jgi:putative glycosyltransferase (TIGR04372 family)
MNWQGRKDFLTKKLKGGDYKGLNRLILRRLFINLILRPIGVPVALIILPAFYLIEPFKKFRVTVLLSERIGHLALNTELFQRRKQLTSEIQDDNLLEIFIAKQGKVANRQLLTMYQRDLCILEHQIYYWIYASIEWVFTRTRFHFELTMSDNEDFEFSNTNTSLHFTEDEETKGRELLNSMGIDNNVDWFVCIHSRDNRYLSTHFPEKNWSYHNYRDSDINDFHKAIQFIIDNGGFVIRMGSEVELPLTFHHEKVVDYSHNYCSDFMDIFLISKCKFFLGTSAGICDVATVLNKPRLSVNYSPFGVALFGKDSFYIPKKLKNKETGKYLSLSEFLNREWDKEWADSDWLDKHCFEYEDNTPDEILAATKEMLYRVEGVFRMSDEETDLMKKYSDLFRPKNLSFNNKTPVGLDFLKKNPDVFWQ